MGNGIEKELEMEVRCRGDNSCRMLSKDLVGKKFGRLTVISLKSVGKYTRWNCRCDCGNEKDVYQHNLISGDITSCGCRRRESARKYGQKNLHVYKGTQIEKAMANKVPKNNTSGVRGVSKEKKSGNWRARLVLQGTTYSLGTYERFEDAVSARLEAEKMRNQIIEEYLKQQKVNEEGLA